MSGPTSTNTRISPSARFPVSNDLNDLDRSRGSSLHDADNDQVDHAVPVTTFCERRRRCPSPDCSPRCSIQLKNGPMYLRERRGRSLAPRKLTISRAPALAHSPRKLEPLREQHLPEVSQPVTFIDVTSIYNGLDQRHPRAYSVTNAEAESKADNLNQGVPTSNEDVLAAFSRYDARWNRLSARPTKFPLNFKNVPWPLLVSPRSAADVNVDSITEFILHPIRVGSTSETRRRMLEDESKKWDPEHVEQFISIAIRNPSDRMNVKEKAAVVYETVRHLM